MTRDEREVIVRARNWLSKPGQWIQGSSARTGRGSATYTTNENATCWCLTGAIHRAACEITGAELADRAPTLTEGNREFFRLYRGAIITVAKYIPDLDHAGVFVWNDRPNRTQEEVVALLDHILAVES